MRWSEEIELGTTTTTENEYGDPVQTDEWRSVLANRKSVRQSEYYQAAQTGLRPEIMFEVRSIEYEGEEKLCYRGKVYAIIRTYEREDEITELVCGGLVSD